MCVCEGASRTSCETEASPILSKSTIGAKRDAGLSNCFSVERRGANIDANTRRTKDPILQASAISHASPVIAICEAAGRTQSHTGPRSIFSEKRGAVGRTGEVANEAKSIVVRT